MYLNGYLSLWGKNVHNNILYEIDSRGTPALDEQYNLIKSISHCSVWLNLILQSVIDEAELNKQHEEDLNSVRTSLMELKRLRPVEINSELAVINKILNYISKILKARSLIQMHSLQIKYLEDMKSINESYASLATKLQLTGLHEIVSQWISTLNIQLDSSRILIVSAHGPREDLIEKQYFLDLYAKQGMMDAEKGTSHIICVEMLPEQIATVSKDSLIDFLKKHQLNMSIGRNMLGDPQAMNKDVLGAYAPDVLKTICPFHAQKTDVNSSEPILVPHAASSIHIGADVVNVQSFKM